MSMKVKDKGGKLSVVGFEERRESEENRRMGGGQKKSSKIGGHHQHLFWVNDHERKVNPVSEVMLHQHKTG